MDSARLSLFQRKILNFRQEYRSLIALLESKYPDYFQLKYELKVSTVASVREKLLTDKKGFIEFFWGDSTLYIFGISRDQIIVEQIALQSELEENIFKLQRSLTDRKWFDSDTNYKNAFEEFVASASFLYQKLIPSQLREKDRLIIIPDGLLGYLPFDIFLYDQPASTQIDYRPLPYFLEKSTIRYGYSATLLVHANGQQTQKKSALSSFGGFAPIYPIPGENAETSAVRQSDEELFPLQYNQPEVQAIRKTIWREIPFWGKLPTGKSSKKSQTGSEFCIFQAIRF